MPFAPRTAILAVAALTLSIWNIHGARQTTKQQGLPVRIPHACSLQEFFDQVGDQRLIIVTKMKAGLLEINETHIDEAGLQKDFALIFGIRTTKLAWFRADAEVSYGDAARVLSEMYQSGFHPALSLLTPASEQFDAANFPKVSLCPL